MNKSESKYFNTARLMDEALLILLEKKDIEEITVKEICEKAGVNRSTFYLHYDTIDDLFQETIERLNNDFYSSFDVQDISGLIKNGNKKYLEAEINNEEMAGLFFTSGTTDLAKAVELSHKNIASNDSDAFVDNYNYDYIIENSVLEDAVSDVMSIIRAGQLEIKNTQNKIREVITNA